MVSYWLLTSDKLLNSLVDRFSKEFNTPFFKPHITLISGLKIREDTAYTNLKKLKDEFSSLDLFFTDIGFEDELSRSFYFMPEKNEKLFFLRKKIESLFKNKEYNSNFNPHLSLFYYNCGLNRKRQIKAELFKCLPYTAKFDSLGMIVESSPIKKPEDVKTWKFFQI